MTHVIRPRTGSRGAQPSTTPTIMPRPNGWVTVRCADCGKVLCEAQRGSVVKVVCRKCKSEQVTQVA